MHIVLGRVWALHRRSLTYDAGPTRDQARPSPAMCGFRPCVAGQHLAFLSRQKMVDGIAIVLITITTNKGSYHLQKDIQYKVISEHQQPGQEK